MCLVSSKVKNRNTMFSTKYIFWCILAILVAYFAKAYFVDYNPGEVAPWPIFVVSIALSKTFQYLETLTTPTVVKVIRDASVFWKSQVVFILVKLDIATVLDRHNSLTITELAQYANIQSIDRLERLMRAAESIGYFTENKSTGKWSNTAYSQFLSTTFDLSISNFLGHVEDSLGPFMHLGETIKDGVDLPAFDRYYGKNMWDYFLEHPNMEKKFISAMIELDRHAGPPMTHDYNWGAYPRVIDVAGSLGFFLARILRHYPNVKGVLFDREHVVAEAKELWKSQYSDLQSRITFHNGSFFDTNSMPKFQPNDLLLLRSILHDWKDENAIQILRAIRSAIGTTPAVKLAIVDIIISSYGSVYDPASDIKHLGDLIMMAQFHARERTEAELKELLRKSGFNLVTTSLMRSVATVALAEPIPYEW